MRRMSLVAAAMTLLAACSVSDDTAEVGDEADSAVLSDSDWLKKAAEIEGALFPGIEIKSFGLDGQEVAEAWLAL